MNLKRLHLLFFSLSAMLIVLQSCEIKTKKQPVQKSNLAEINQLVVLAEKELQKEKYDSSYYYFNKAKSLCDVKKDTDIIIHALLNMAAIEQKQGDYSSSETTILEAFPFLKNNPNPEQHWGVYAILGTNYLHSFDYKLAFYYNNLALNLKTGKRQKAIIKNNIATVYMGMHDYSKAIEILLPLSSQKEVVDDSELASSVLDNLGYSYFKTNNSKALEYLNKSLKLRGQKTGNWGMAESYLHLSEYYKKHQPNLAYTYALLAYEKASKLDDPANLLASLKLLVQNGSYEQSKIYSEKYILLNDSITKVHQITKNQFAKIKYDSRQAKLENLRLKTQETQTALELEQQKNRNLILNFLIISGLLCIIYFYYFFKAIAIKEKIQTAYDTETRIAKRLHDELANDVFQAMAFAETQDLTSSKNKELLLNSLDGIYSRTRNISKENSTINTGQLFFENLKEMMEGFNNQAIRILVNGMDSVPWNTLGTNKKIIVYRVIQELLVNMKKHSECSLAVISFRKEGKKLQIDYRDNGIGIKSDKINSRNGLQNVENRIRSINGTITFDVKSNKGFKTSFTIPI